MAGGFSFKHWIRAERENLSRVFGGARPNGVETFSGTKPPSPPNFSNAWEKSDEKFQALEKSVGALLDQYAVGFQRVSNERFDLFDGTAVVGFEKNNPVSVALYR